MDFLPSSSPGHHHGGRYNALVTARDTGNLIGLYRSDRPLSANEEPALGAHLVTPRFAFAHHGIYVGGGNVVHYAAMARQFRRAPVEEVSLVRFAHGHAIFVRPHVAPRFADNEVIGRARSRVGEDSYHVFRNNCEHFCEWCVQGEPRSRQVECIQRLASALANTICTAVALPFANHGRALGR